MAARVRLDTGKVELYEKEYFCQGRWRQTPPANAAAAMQAIPAGAQMVDAQASSQVTAERETMSLRSQPCDVMP
jgi:hypothetical protein